MRTWDYAKSGGTAWPVKPGDLWAVGEHRLLCDDLEAGGGLRLAGMAGTSIALVYTDPPWGRGVHRAFRTKAGLAGPDHDALMAAILGLCTLARHALIEMSYRDVEALIGYATPLGLIERARWAITWDRGRRPCLLLAFTSGPHPYFTDQDDANTPGIAIDYLTEAGDLVVDPCTGLGFTAEAAARLGRRFLGSELHPNRCSATLEKLRRAGHGIPELVERRTT